MSLDFLPDDLTGWNESIQNLPGAHILQSSQWAASKAANGWRSLPQVWKDTAGCPTAAALILERTVPGLLKLRVQYVPRGPLLDWSNPLLRGQVLDDLQAQARRRGAIFIKMDPEVILGTGIPGAEDAVELETGAAFVADLQRRGWRYSGEQVQFRNTVQVDLAASEEVRLSRLKQKWRYNLRLAERKGVGVRAGSEADLPLLYKMYAETSVRDGFVIRSQEYYLAVWRMFMTAGMATPLIAEIGGEPVSALVLFHFARRAWYLYGMSRDLHRERMPNHLLQWEAMRRAAALGCLSYDLWGAPEVFNESDSMWGVFRFKEGLGGQVVRTPGAWDYPVQPFLYDAYTRILPRLLDFLRRRGRAKTQREVSS
jgi:peptidoglycan pentaglycine glycine transferase (the first glycine)